MGSPCYLIMVCAVTYHSSVTGRVENFRLCRFSFLMSSTFCFILCFDLQMLYVLYGLIVNDGKNPDFIVHKVLLLSGKVCISPFGQCFLGQPLTLMTTV